ncbi:hypothetical protein HNV12_00420 [Methanococcoides sp. SA1]|nr:hypothetical protein [Methanococcoides sp. SA1]
MVVEFDDEEYVGWTDNLKCVLRSEQFKDLREKCGYCVDYLDSLEGMEPEYEWRIEEEIISGNIPRQIKEAMPYLVDFCEKENVEVYEIIPDFSMDGWNPNPMFYFESREGVGGDKKWIGHGFLIEGIKGSLEKKVE